MSSTFRPKLTEQVNVAVTESTKSALERIHRKHGILPAEIGRQGFAEMIGRIEAGPVTTAERKALADFRKLTGQCPVKALRTAAKQLIASTPN